MNRPNSLKRTIDKMLASSTCPSEIIVVDQTQEKEKQKEIEKFVKETKVEGMRCCYFYQQEPSSTKARNYGIRKATKKILVFSDDDVDVERHTFENLETIFSDKKIALVAGLDSNMIKSRGNPLGYFFGTKSWRKRKIGHVTLSMLGRFPVVMQDIVETEWAMGYFFAVRRELVNQWNLQFDENLTSYAYAEDLDFSYSYYKQAKKNGLKCVISSKIVVNHLGSLEYRIPSAKAIYVYVINREYLSYKHNKNRLSRLATRWTNFWMYIGNLKQPSVAKLYRKAQACCDQMRHDLRNGIIPK